MAKDAQIHIALDSEQKARWEEYVEESNTYDSVTNLIRQSVESQIGEGSQSSASPSPAIAADIQDLKDDVESIQNDVSWLRNQSQDDVNISDLAQEVFDELEPLPQPPASLEIPNDVEDEETYRQQQAAHQVITPDSTSEADSDGGNPQTAEAIASRLDSTTSRVRAAIDHLQNQFLPVEEVQLDGEIHYFRGE